MLATSKKRSATSAERWGECKRNQNHLTPAAPVAPPLWGPPSVNGVQRGRFRLMRLVSRRPSPRGAKTIRRGEQALNGCPCYYPRSRAQKLFFPTLCFSRSSMSAVIFWACCFQLSRSALVSSSISRSSSTSRSNELVSKGVSLPNIAGVTSVPFEMAGQTRKSSDASMIQPPPSRGFAVNFPFFMALVMVGTLLPTFFAACDADNFTT